MVEPVDAVVERSEPGEVEVEGKVAVKFSISDVRVAKVSHGFIVATGVNIIARFLKSPERIIGLCGPGVQHRAASFVAKRIATAVVKTDGDERIEIYVEPVAVGLADGFITPWGEPCVSLQTVTAWRTVTAT
jgi:hypothetical protein